MKFRKNNNNKVITHLAVNSVKSSRMRNFFIIFTITLSVSLLMVMSLFTAGMNTTAKRQAADMQHVIYNKVSDAQIEALVQDERVEVLLLYKAGKGMEVDNKLIQPVWTGVSAVKGDSSAMGMADIITGSLPEAMHEIAVGVGFCEFIGVEEKVGTEVMIPFLDGTAEAFIIKGILEAPLQTDRYNIVFSDAYAKEGKQLKDISYQAVIRIHNAARMSQNEFLDVVRDIAAKNGIERKEVNENNYFLDTLPGGTRQSSEIVTIAALAIMILFVSILVIYSVFYLSVMGRVRQFGQLRTLGMSRKQIKMMITKEGLLLSAVGIPIGVMIGGTIAYLLQKSGWDWRNSAYITAGVIVADIVTVLISVRKPAKLAAMISPIEASKYTGLREKKNVIETKRLHRKLTPMNLAAMGIVRNGKKTLLTMISLGVGGILFMVASTFIVSMSLDEFSRQGTLEYGEFVINLSYNIAATSEHGIVDMQMNNPLNEELERKIMAIDGVKKIVPFKKTVINWESNGASEAGDSVTGFAKGEITNEILAEGTLDYDDLVKNNEIYIQKNNIVEEIFGWKFKLGDKVKFILYNGEEEIEKEFTVGGILADKQWVKNPIVGFFLLPEESLNLLMNNMNLNAEMAVSTEENKRDLVEEQLNAILDEYPMLTMKTLREVKIMDEASWKLVFTMIIGLSIFIIGFSIINLINTLITNIITRKQEFAMLQSIGMTNTQLNRMVQIEGILLALSNLMITLIFGTAAGYYFIELFHYFDVSYMHFTFPAIYFIGYAAFIAAVPVLVSTIVLRCLRNHTLIERLRVVD